MKAVTMGISGRMRRKGMTRQNRKSRWSMPSRICSKAHHHEAAGGVVPAGIQRHQARIAFQLIGAGDAVRAQDHGQRRDFMQRQPVEGGMDGEIGSLRLDGIVEQNIELALFPEDLGVGRQAAGPSHGPAPGHSWRRRCPNPATCGAETIGDRAVSGRLRTIPDFPASATGGGGAQREIDLCRHRHSRRCGG